MFFSEILKRASCTLCWYQRIFLFPQVFLFGTALLTEDSKIWKYSLPILVPGVFISAYHVLLYEGILPEPPSLCAAGVSCTTQYLRVLGIFSMPMLALIAGVVLSSISPLLMRIDRLQQHPQDA